MYSGKSFRGVLSAHDRLGPLLGDPLMVPDSVVEGFPTPRALCLTPAQVATLTCESRHNLQREESNCACLRCDHRESCVGVDVARRSGDQDVELDFGHALGLDFDGDPVIIGLKGMKNSNSK